MITAITVVPWIFAAGATYISYLALQNNKAQRGEDTLMKQVDQKIDTLSEKVEGRFNVVDEKLNHTATKEDIIESENRLKDWMKQELVSHDSDNKPLSKGR